MNNGSHIATKGYNHEILVTDFVNYYIDKRNYTDHNSAYDLMVDFTPAVDTDVKSIVGEIGYQDLVEDSNKAAQALVDFTNDEYGELKGATRVGGDHLHGMKKATGKISSGDILLDFKDGRQIGVNVKHYAAEKKAGTAQMFNPTALTVAKELDWMHEELFGNTFGLVSCLKTTVENTKVKNEVLYRENHDQLVEIFGINEARHKNRSGKENAYYRPFPMYNMPVLNKPALSHIRSLVENNDAWARQFYTDLCRTNLQMKQELAEHYYEVLKRIFQTEDKEIHNKLFRFLLNVAQDEADTHLETFLLSTVNRRGKVVIEICHPQKAIEKYLNSVEKIPLEHPAGRSIFHVGPIQFTMALDPGVMSGGIKMMVEKSVLAPIREYNA